jgi:hypothetical protein
MENVDDKIMTFLDLLKKRTVDKIEDTDIKIKESCTATLLLLFAAIDSLSKITCTDQHYQKYLKNKSGVKDRFKGFLEEVMGNQYKDFSENIFNLRNDIVHIGIASNVTLSKDQIRGKHLQLINGCLWINTNKFLDDFKKVLGDIENSLNKKTGVYYQNAITRLQNIKFIDIDGEDIGEPSPSPGIEDGLFGN